MIAHTLDAVKSGTYNYQRIGAYVIAAGLTVIALSEITPSLPPVVVPVIAFLLPWSKLVTGAVAIFLAKLGKPVVVKAPEVAP